MQCIFQKIRLCFQVCYLIDFADMKHTLYFLKRTKLISYFSKKYHFLKMNLFELFLLSNQKHPPYDQTFQKAILAKFPLQFQGIIQKKYGRIVFWQSQKRLHLGFWVAQGVQGDALVKTWVQSPRRIFFFRIKHAKTVNVRVNIG